MSYSFWGSYNAKYVLTKKDTKFSLMKEDSLVWEKYIDNINVVSADIFNDGTVILHSDKMCYIIKAGSSRIEPMVDISFENLCKSNDKFIKFSADGTHCMFLRYNIKKGFSLFGSKQTINDKSQIEYELILWEMESKKYTVLHKFVVINKISNHIFWNVSRDFSNSFLIVPREDSKSIKFDIKRFDLRNNYSQKNISIPACSIVYTEMYKTGTVLLMHYVDANKGILIITPDCETFNIAVDNNESCIFLARGFVVLEKIGSSSERIFTIKDFKDGVIANYSMLAFKNQNVDFGVFFDEKDFLAIVYYFKDKFYFYPADVLTLTTEIKRFEMIVESDRQSKVYETGTSYFEDYYDSPNLDEPVEENKTEKKVENFDKSQIDTPLKKNNFKQPARQISFTPKKEITKQKVLKVSPDFSNISIPKSNVSSLDISNKVNSSVQQKKIEVSNNIPLQLSVDDYDNLQQSNYSDEQEFESLNLNQNVGRNSGRLNINPQQIIEQDFQNVEQKPEYLSINSKKLSTDSINEIDSTNNIDPSDVDPQTGLYNAAFCEKKLFELADQCKLTGLEFSVLRIVLDNYQNLEEYFGERYVLTMRKMVIDLINRAFPKDCFICIISECEFSLIMNGVSFDEAYSKAFVIHNRISEIRFTYQTEILSSSIIVGTFPTIESDIYKFKDYIEKGIIFALNSGGNQVVTLREVFPHELESVSKDFANIDNFDKLNVNNVNDEGQKKYSTFLDIDSKKSKKDKVKIEEPVNNVDVEIKKLNKLLESIEDRYLLGEINESSYNDLKAKYLRQLNSVKNKEN